MPPAGRSSKATHGPQLHLDAVKLVLNGTLLSSFTLLQCPGNGKVLLIDEKSPKDWPVQLDGAAGVELVGITWKEETNSAMGQPDEGLMTDSGVNESTRTSTTKTPSERSE